MKTPMERYMNDPEFNALVTHFEQFLRNAQYTPSELREAVILAATNIEIRKPMRTLFDNNPEVSAALDLLNDYARSATHAKARGTT